MKNEGPINETNQSEPGIEDAWRDYATVHIRFQTPEKAIRFLEFIKQEITKETTS